MSYNLTRRDITHEIENSDHHFVAKVIRRGQQRPDGTPTVLGWVRFDSGTGVIEMTNCNAQLGSSFVDIGGSTKTKSNALAGGYGEGAKIAALILTRDGYQVQYQATSFNWKFYLGGPKGQNLFCSLTPISDRELGNRRAQHEAALRQGTSRDMVSNPWEDVMVRIGSIQSGKGRKVTMEEFRAWIKVSLDLHRPSNTIETGAGSIILDENFRGKIFLKGLHLENYQSSKLFKYGYNFANGSVDRDRKKMANAHQEAYDLAKLWAFGIVCHPEVTIAKYAEMMLDDAEWADVNLVERYITRPTLQTIWQFLLNKDPARKVFYHDDRNGDLV
ncbi:hypothetical protein DL95DRAFT_315740 [Leptodontidium sp. 2 PMI_412]|nr:hypothetical protein DL95DRAFT_315740 [Leptodontidium sp. 2 PMI_412]